MPDRAPRDSPEGWARRITGLFEALAGRAPASSVLSALVTWLGLVTHWNERVHLTAARSADELVDLLFADAVVIANSHAAEPRERWLDVGSGVGAPGIPLALLMPLVMTLIEPREKRVAFLRSSVGALKLPDIRVERQRVEDLPDACAEYAVSRATFAPELWLREGTRLATHGVWVLLAQSTPPTLAGYAPVTDREYAWPLTRVARRALLYRPARPASSSGSP